MSRDAWLLHMPPPGRGLTFFAKCLDVAAGFRTSCVYRYRLYRSCPKRKRATRRWPHAILLQQQAQIGAGEEIRTLDPNLGKVVLYP